MSARAWTKGPLEWRRVGKSIVLVRNHGRQPFVLDCGRDALLRNDEEGMMQPFDPKHPDALMLRAAPDLFEALEECELRMSPLIDHGDMEHNETMVAAWNAVVAARAALARAKA